jgi:hypothetical protein
MRAKNPRHFSLGEQEWLLRAGDRRARDIVVTYKGTKLNRVTGLILLGELKEQ